MSQSLKEILERSAYLKTLYPEGDQEPHMFGYWVEKKGFEEAMTEYYPGTLRENDEIRTLFYVWRATEMSSLKTRICEIMVQQSADWLDKHGEELGL